MKIDTRVDESKKLTTHTLSGRISLDHIRGIVEAFYKKGPTDNVLWDFRKADAEGKVTINELEQLASFVRKGQEVSGRGKTAIVASSDLIFGLARTYESLAEIEGVKNPVRVFRSMERAVKWLEKK